jgi:hypothetical protein
MTLVICGMGWIFVHAILFMIGRTPGPDAEQVLGVLIGGLGAIFMGVFIRLLPRRSPPPGISPTSI